MSQAIAELREWLLTHNMQAFLRVIRAGETSQDDIAYFTLYGGSTFTSVRDHPRKVITAGRYTSSAAGAYQFLQKTWDGLVKQYGFPDFTPEMQDLGAVALIKGRGAIPDVLAGRLESAIRKCAKEWASLPFSPYPQPRKTMEQCRAVYLKYGGTLAESKPTEVSVAPIVLPLLQAAASLIPQLGSLFADSDNAKRNVAAGHVIAETLVKATEAVNLQEAVERIQTDPTALAAAKEAVASIWPQITEAGGGGIEGAGKRNIESAQIPLYRQAPFVMGVMLLPLIYIVVLASIGKWEYIGDVTSETRAQVIGTVLGVLLGGFVGYYYGTSAGSARKTDLIAGKA